LATRLKRADVPIDIIGVQGHIRGNTALDKPGMVTFLKQIQALGLETMITEFDVDDVDVPASLVDQTVADKYREFIDLMAPFVRTITFEELTDDPNIPRRSDGLLPRPNMLDLEYQLKPAYSATVKALMSLPKV
jgi:GH35 family endo-1,4-beta-xylanase